MLVIYGDIWDICGSVVGISGYWCCSSNSEEINDVADQRFKRMQNICQHGPSVCYYCSWSSDTLFQVLTGSKVKEVNCYCILFDAPFTSGLGEGRVTGIVDPRKS